MVCITDSGVGNCQTGGSCVFEPSANVHAQAPRRLAIAQPSHVLMPSCSVQLYDSRRVRYLDLLSVDRFGSERGDREPIDLAPRDTKTPKLGGSPRPNRPCA